MTTSVLRREIKKLSFQEKFALFGDLWEELGPAAEESFVLTPAQQRELVKRYRQFQKNPQTGRSWSQVKARLISGHA